MKIKAKRPRNEQALALRIRAGNAGVAIAVDTRPKRIASAKAYTRKGRRTHVLD